MAGCYTDRAEVVPGTEPQLQYAPRRPIFGDEVTLSFSKLPLGSYDVLLQKSTDTGGQLAQTKVATLSVTNITLATTSFVLAPTYDAHTETPFHVMASESLHVTVEKTDKPVLRAKPTFVLTVY